MTCNSPHLTSDFKVKDRAERFTAKGTERGRKPLQIEAIHARFPVAIAAFQGSKNQRST